MSEFFQWITTSPLGVVAVIVILIVLFTLVGAFYDWRIRRQYPDKSKKGKGKGKGKG